MLDRWTGKVRFTAEIETTPDMARGWKLRLAVAWALANAVPCTSLDLAGVDFTDYTCPAGSRFVGSSFVGSSFVGSRFVGSRFVGSSFVDSRFVDSSFVDSSFDGNAITRRPVSVSGLDYSVSIIGAHMQIGCQKHLIADWRAFDDRQIAEMDGLHATRFWKAHRDRLLTLAGGHAA